MLALSCAFKGKRRWIEPKTNKKITTTAGRAAKNHIVQPNSDFDAGGKRFQPIKQDSLPVKNMNDIWVKPVTAARDRAAEPFERCAKPLASEMAWLTGTAITALALPVGRSGVVKRPEAKRK